MFLLATTVSAWFEHSMTANCEDKEENNCGGNCEFDDILNCIPSNVCLDSPDSSICVNSGTSPSVLCEWHELENKCDAARSTPENCLSLESTADVCGLMGPSCVHDPRIDHCVVQCDEINVTNFPLFYKEMCERESDITMCVLDEDEVCGYTIGCLGYAEYICEYVGSSAGVRGCGWLQDTDICFTEGDVAWASLTEEACHAHRPYAPDLYWKDDMCHHFDADTDVCTDLPVSECEYITSLGVPCYLSYDSRTTCQPITICENIHEDRCEDFTGMHCILDGSSCSTNPDCSSYTSLEDCESVSSRGCIFDDESSTCKHSNDCGDYMPGFCSNANEFVGIGCVLNPAQTKCVPTEVCEDYTNEAACALIQETNSDCYFEDSVCKTFIDCTSTSLTFCNVYSQDHKCHIDQVESICTDFSSCEAVPGRTCYAFEEEHCVKDGANCILDTDCNSYSGFNDCIEASNLGFGCVFQGGQCSYATSCISYGADFCDVAGQHSEARCVVNEAEDGCVASDVCEDYKSEASCAAVSTTNKDCFYADGLCQTFSTCASIPVQTCDSFSISHDCHLNLSEDECVDFIYCDLVPESQCEAMSQHFCVSDGSVCGLNNNCSGYSQAGETGCSNGAEFGCIFLNGECTYSSECSDYSKDYCDDAKNHNDIGCTFDESLWECVTSNVCEDYRTRAACSLIKETNDECYFDGSDCLTFTECENLTAGECENFTFLHYCHLDEPKTSCESFTTCEAVPEAACLDFADMYCVTDGTSCMIDPICSHYTDGGFNACSIASEFGCVYELSNCVYSNDCSDYSAEHCDDASFHHNIGCSVVNNECSVSMVCSDYKTQEACDEIQESNPDCYFLDNTCNEFSTCSVITDADICTSYIHTHDCHMDAEGNECVSFSECSNVYASQCSFFTDDFCNLVDDSCTQNSNCLSYVSNAQCALASEFGCIWDGGCNFSLDCSDYGEDYCADAGFLVDIGCRVDDKGSCQTSEFCEDYKTSSACGEWASEHEECFFDGDKCLTFTYNCNELEPMACLFAHAYGCVYDTTESECVYSEECDDYRNEVDCLGATFNLPIGCKWVGECTLSTECSDYRTREACYAIRSTDKECYFDDESCNRFTSCADLTVYGQESCRAASLFGCKYDYDEVSGPEICSESQYCEDYNVDHCPISISPSLNECVVYYDTCESRITTTASPAMRGDGSLSAYNRLFIVVTAIIVALF